jgi:putative acetyltransferase
MPIVVRPEPANSPDAIVLLRARDAETDALYPPEAQFGIPIEKHVRDDVHFFLVREAGAAIGCGALECHDGYAEMKSVYLMPKARGRRLGQQIILALEDFARELGYEEVRLETGNRSPWAVKTYERAGYDICARFGAYSQNAYSVFMRKRLPAVG